MAKIPPVANMSHFDVVVCGLGVMGSAALYALAQRGARVAGLDRFEQGHDRGSSHGETRIIRRGYFEHPSYVPLVERSYAKWREIEAAAGRQLLHVTGIIEIGPPDGVLVRGTLAAMKEHNVPHEKLSASELMRRFPAFRIPADFVGTFQGDGGYLEAEASLAALAALAGASGAELRRGETIAAIEPSTQGVRVLTNRGAIWGRTVIVTLGPWLETLFPGLPARLRITRQVLAWFSPRDPARVANGKLPVFLLQSRHGIHYGFPLRGSSVKIAKHHHADQAVDPETYDRTVSAADEALIRAALEAHLPAINGPLLSAKTCLYTRSGDDDFIIDRLPGAPQVVIASPCSGHGFKFAPAIGDILADLALAGATVHDISRFSLDRFKAI
ncbi:MAG TPA: N-methyl-L-tryptophan oxidase [Xanthobacteraceae bacterium]|jgi:sarcosine oxidase|nr:N-methyl-L-tryptophan oxidase [Xanthobacteraceae bacterium]